MSYNCGFFKSKDNKHDIAYYVFMPKGEVRAAVQMSHGMCEYFLRYKHVGEFLNENGIAFFGNDHLGHGNSIASDDDKGYFAPENGWQTVVEDMYTLNKMMKERLPGVRFIMFGHSMGSFLARAYMVKHASSIDGAVICGTGDGISGASALLTVCEAVKLAKGERYRSEKINNVAFGKYNERFTDENDPCSWLSRDLAVRDKYRVDPKSSFIFTVNGFENLTKVLYYVSDDRWYDAVRKDLPIYLIAGTDDPVGSYGKDVTAVYDKLKDRDCQVEIKLYDQARHELVNEINKDEVLSDILSFIEESVISPDMIEE
ncbi:MAG: alpha/beta fold hydrolase [Ruminococcus sp.]|nr:alpha/beta fold hydrolase [Ruminococcus sp.]